MLCSETIQLSWTNIAETKDYNCGKSDEWWHSISIHELLTCRSGLAVSLYVTTVNRTCMVATANRGFHSNCDVMFSIPNIMLPIYDKCQQISCTTLHHLTQHLRLTFRVANCCVDNVSQPSNTISNGLTRNQSLEERCDGLQNTPQCSKCPGIQMKSYRF